MHIDSAQSDDYQRIDSDCKLLTQKLFDGFSMPQPPITLGHINNLYADGAHQNTLFVVEAGSLSCAFEERVLYHLDEGDLVGLHQQYDLLATRYYSDHYIELRPFTFDDFNAHIHQNDERINAWSRYLLSESARLAMLVGLLNKSENRAALGFKSFKTGETIIEENTPADEVYAIVEGHADVYVNAVRVGEVLEDEIFGALALLTDNPRTATVIASKDSLVLVVPKHQFKTLMETHPHICMNLMENMARQIVSLNGRVHPLETP